MNNSVQRDKLKALVDLQGILTSQQLALHELEAVRQQVAELSTPSISTAYSPPGINATASYPSSMNAPQHIVTNNIAQASAPVPLLSAVPSHLQQQPQSELSILNSSRLADILASAKAQQAPPTPPNAPTPVPYSQPSVTPVPVSSSGGDSNSLLAQLRAAGFLAPNGNTPVNGPHIPPSLHPPANALSHTPTTPRAELARPSKVTAENDVELNMASLKKYKLLVRYERQ